MPGRHASTDNTQFYRDIAGFLLRWLLVAVVVFGFGWFLTTRVLGSASDSIPPVTEQVVASSVTSEPGTAVDPTTAPPSSVSTSVPATSAPTTAATSTTGTVPETTTTTVAATTLGPVKSPSEITVRVLNSTGRSGLAAEVTADLAALGYQMRLQDNYNTPLDTTTVFYVAGLEREAEILAGQLPGTTTIAPNPAPEPSADLLVVLGASYP